MTTIEPQTPTDRQRAHWQASPDQATWASSAADAIATALKTDLQQADQALLLLSGGNTPTPVYRALATAALDWSRVRIGLVDERWAAPDSLGSHARLIRETLLQGAAAAATFMPLVTALTDPEQCARTASEHLRELGLTPSAVVLGMDDDGHTASLFARAGGLEHALNTADAYAAIDASGCDGAGAWPTRITLTPAGLAQARTRVLLIHGASKRRVFELALTGEDAHAMSVRAAIQVGTTPLRVYWYA